MSEFLISLIVGFLAQIVDGALGMAYGVISSALFLSFGMPPANASAAVHAAEIFTTGTSGASHLYHRNVDWRLLARLAPAGIVGGALGAYVLTGISGSAMRPYVSAYLALVGVLIIVKAIRPFPPRPVPTAAVVPLGAIGGFADAVGGGGWGPVVTSSLLGAGGHPRYVIGTVNATEFLVTVSVSLAFLGALLSGRWEETEGLIDYAPMVAGLIVGGVVAAPLAGYAIARLPIRPLMAAVGALVLALSLVQLAAVFKIFG